MHKNTRYHYRICRLFREHFNLHTPDCEVYSIWHFYPQKIWRGVREYFSSSAICQAQWFTFIYWLVLAISALGTIYSCIEFISLYFGSRRCVSTWRERKYYVLPYSVLVKCRLVGSLVMVNAWLMLCYAIIIVAPSLMTPWIKINMFVLSFEVITWIIEVLIGATPLQSHTMLTFLLPIANLLFVRSVRNVFQRAIELNESEDLRLWKRF